MTFEKIKISRTKSANIDWSSARKVKYRQIYEAFATLPMNEILVIEPATVKTLMAVQQHFLRKYNEAVLDFECQAKLQDGKLYLRRAMK